MLKFIARALSVVIAVSSFSSARGEILTTTHMEFPYRPVAATEDVYALRYNPAGMAFDTPVEFAFIHQFSRSGPGGDNSLTLRAKTLAVSVNWIKNRGNGKRREYLVGGGYALSPQVSFGTTFSYIKADDVELNDKQLWTHSLYYAYSPLIAAGIRWENPWHTEIDGRSTDGLIVAGVAVRPLGSMLSVHADWFTPDRSSADPTFLRGSAQFRLSSETDLAGFIDTEGRFGIELRLLRQRSAAGIEARGTDRDGYTDGSFYISVLNHRYRNPERPGTPLLR